MPFESFISVSVIVCLTNLRKLFIKSQKYLSHTKFSLREDYSGNRAGEDHAGSCILEVVDLGHSGQIQHQVELGISK